MWGKTLHQKSHMTQAFTNAIGPGGRGGPIKRVKAWVMSDLWAAFSPLFFCAGQFFVILRRNFMKF